MKLTTTAIAHLALPDGIDDKIYFCEDLAGFGLRLRRSGDRSWWVQYSLKGRTRKLRLGSLAELDIGRARSTAKTVLAQVRLGRDPASEKDHARVRAAETFGALLESFMIRQQGRIKPRSLVETRRHLETLCRPLHPLPITALTRRTIAARLTAIAETNGPAAANRVRGSLGAFCTWAIKQGLLDSHPVAFTDRAPENGPRQRLLSDVELSRIWQALAGDQYGTVVKLLVLTGLRRGEIGGLRWSEIDLEANLISLPPERTKNGRVHVVPMSPPVRALLVAQPRQDGRDLVFGEAAVSGFSLWAESKVALDRRLAGTVSPWVLHDARRAFSTTLHERFNTPPHIVETLLGHAGGHKAGTAGVYNKSAYLTECARALDRWADHVVALGTGERPPAVVNLRGRRA